MLLMVILSRLPEGLITGIGGLYLQVMPGDDGRGGLGGIGGGGGSACGVRWLSFIAPPCAEAATATYNPHHISDGRLRG
jgi:hypothetical protein